LRQDRHRAGVGKSDKNVKLMGIVPPRATRCPVAVSLAVVFKPIVSMVVRMHALD
jgi:hypothetical protein